MRRFFTGLWRALTFPFILLFNVIVLLFQAVFKTFWVLWKVVLLLFGVIAFPFRAIHKRFPKFFPAMWKIVSFPFRALYRRFPRFFNGLWKIISFPFWLVYKIIVFPFQAAMRARRFLNSEPEESALVDAVAGIISNDKVRAQMWQHIETLRMHIIRSVIALVVGIGISFLFTQQFAEYLAQPIGGLQNLKAIEVTETIGVFMRVAMFTGIALAVPYITFEMWLFAAPGLHSHEKKMGLAGIPLALIFFLGGAAFTFYVMLPAALPFLSNFMGVATELRPQSYYSFVTGLMFWIGLFFEYPLVIYVLSSIGIIEPKILREQWKIAVVIITIVAAAVTPTVDPINQGLVMAPMIALYFLSIGFSYIAQSQRKRKQAQAEKTT